MSELLYSTDELWYGTQTGRVLTGEIDAIYATLGKLDDKYAAKEHTHSEYATVDMLNTKADAKHNHDDVYYKKSEVDEKIEALKVELMALINKASTDTKTETKDEPSAPETDVTVDSGTANPSAE
jgi:hypothetical protein